MQDAMLHLKHTHMFKGLLGLLIVSTTWGCHTPTPPDAPIATTVNQDEDLPEWRKRAAPQLDAEIAFAPTTFAFDHFVVSQDASVEQIWLVLHPVLGWLANHERGEDIELGYVALMNELEPMAAGYDSRTHMEVSFLLAQEPGGEAREALGVRLWRKVEGRTPTLSIVLWQDASRRALSSMQVWTHPDIDRGASSALITDTDAIIMRGIVSPDELEQALRSSPNDTTHQASLLPLIHGMVWPQFSDAAYLETPLRPVENSPAQGLHQGLKPALGLRIREREIDEVIPDTSFLPYIDVDSVFGGP
jgi:hypothetical protein